MEKTYMFRLMLETVDGGVVKVLDYNCVSELVKFLNKTANGLRNQEVVGRRM